MRQNTATPKMCRNMGGFSACTFTFTLVLRISLLQKRYFTEKLIIQRIEQGLTEIPKNCDFSQKRFVSQNIEILFFSLKCSSFIPKLFTENFNTFSSLFMRYILSKYFFMEVILSKL